jgi:hypothetical protein
VKTDYALRLLEGREGRCGYLLKDRVTRVDELTEAIRCIAEGKVVVERLMSRPATRFGR